MSDDFKLDKLFSVAGKSVCITGGSSGLGLMMARGLAENGARVIITSRSSEKCEKAVSEIEKFGDCSAIVADVTNPEQRRLLVSQLSDRLGKEGLSVLINNAGTNWGEKLENYPDAGFAKVIDTNLNAVFSLTRDLVAQLKSAASDNNPSRIINIGSMDGLQVPVVQRVPTFAYSASKAALHHLTRVLAVELGPDNVTVNAVAPGFFESRMTDHVLAKYRDDIEADSPLGRIGMPAEIIGVVIYLCSRAGAYTNGTVIPVDGGTSISKGSKHWNN